MKKCECGNDTFREYSMESCYQNGVRIEDNGELNYDEAGTIENSGCGSESSELVCEECGKIYSETGNAQAEPFEEDRLFEFSVVLSGHGKTAAEAWRNAKDSTNLLVSEHIPEYKVV